MKVADLFRIKAGNPIVPKSGVVEGISFTALEAFTDFKTGEKLLVVQNTTEIFSNLDLTNAFLKEVMGKTETSEPYTIPAELFINKSVLIYNFF